VTLVCGTTTESSDESEEVSEEVSEEEEKDIKDKDIKDKDIRDEYVVKLLCIESAFNLPTVRIKF